MAIDVPRAWQIARAAPDGAHHLGCSFVLTNGALLCDVACPVIGEAPEFRCEAFHGRDGALSTINGETCGPCSCGAAAETTA